MKRDDVDVLKLGESKWADSNTGKPTNLPALGLPEHLDAAITGGQTGFQYCLTRKGDLNNPYTQNHFSPSADAALEALKDLLNWEPVRH